MRGPSRFTIALISALAVTALWWQLAEKRARAETARAADLTRRVSVLLDSLRVQRHHVREVAVPRGPANLLEDSDVELLRDLGLKDPVHDLLADLEKHPELISFKGVLGGTMFFDASESAVISPQWVVGYFEDGHIGGHCLLEYRVRPGGPIEWKRLAAKLD